MIEKGIPIPNRMGKKSYAHIFEKMEDGDSVLCDRKMFNAGKVYFGRKKVEIASQKIDEKIYRLWRVKKREKI